MKIRINRNHLRFRLRQHDVTALSENGSIIERIEFGETTDQQFSFSLENSDNENMSIAYNNNKVQVIVPKNVLDTWINTDQVGIAADLTTDFDRTISVLIEKDFACLELGEEDNIGTYTNPLADCRPSNL